VEQNIRSFRFGFGETVKGLGQIKLQLLNL